MPRERDPNRELAEKMWLESSGKLNLVEIASQLGISSGTIRGWKNKDSWESKLNGTLQKTKKRNAPNNTERSKRVGGAPKGNDYAKGHGAPKGNKNATGNSGGGPVGNSKAVTHGFFRRILPDDALAIADEIQIKSSIDILWENIVIQYTAIARAQRIMFVRDQEDVTRVMKKNGDTITEWEHQHAWDKHATFLQAQSRAISTLESLIVRYEDMLTLELKNEKKRLELTELRAKIVKLKGEDEPTEDDGFIDALKGKVNEVWDDDE
jgi:phage terminase small subunit